jgi:hypothetical protein
VHEKAKPVVSPLLPFAAAAQIVVTLNVNSLIEFLFIL